jgi:hypothetical protein
MNPDELSWNIDDPNDMRIIIRYRGQRVMSFSMHEAIESCSRTAVINHIKECDRSPWLKRWNNEKHAVLIDILKS